MSEFNYMVNTFLAKTRPRDTWEFIELIGIPTILWNQIIEFRNDFSGFNDKFACYPPRGTEFPRGFFARSA